jgi:hypothetical protein
MLDVIGLYDGLIKPADLAAIVSANELFEQSGYHNHELPIIETTAIREMENDDKAATIYQIFYDHVDACIMEFGIVLNRDSDEKISLTAMVELLTALLSLDDPSLRDFIAENLDRESDDPAYIIADLLTEFMEKDLMSIYVLFSSVDVALIDKLQELVGDPDLHADLVAQHAAIRERYLNFIKDDKVGIVYEHATRLVTLPASIESTMIHLAEKLDSVFDPVVLAREVYGLTILAGFKDDELLDRAVRALNDHLPDKADLVMMHLKKLHGVINAQA